MAKKKITKKKVKAVIAKFRCSHCKIEYEAMADNSLTATNCPVCNSSVAIRLE